MSKFICFSGASHSGKTTMIKKMVDIFGDKIIVVNECIRSEKINIDEIRSNAKQHILFQQKSIQNKICEEISYFSRNSNDDKKIIIFDRSLVDSYFYLTNYQDKINLTNFEKEQYFNYEKYVRQRMQEHIKNIYDAIFLFQPIYPILENISGFRTVDLPLSQNYEYEMIKALTYYYAEPHCSIFHSDLYDMEKQLINYIECYE